MEPLYNKVVVEKSNNADSLPCYLGERHPTSPATEAFRIRVVSTVHRGIVAKENEGAARKAE
jgi:hypothetical protein